MALRNLPVSIHELAGLGAGSGYSVAGIGLIAFGAAFKVTPACIAVWVVCIARPYQEVSPAGTAVAGKTGNGKRVDIEIETKKYKLKLNLRDTQGAGGYPTRLMGDFGYL